MTPPTVCFFQAYNRTYGRSEALLDGLRENGFPVVTSQVNRPGLARYPLAILRFLRRVRGTDVVIANFRCYEIFPLLRLLTRKPILYDAHLCVWQAVCEERKWFPPDSLRGRLLLFFDRFNCRLADHVLTDTQAHRDFFIETLRVPPEKITAIYISCEDELFQPQPSPPKSGQATVFWAGTGIPHQGLDVIYEAFRELERRGVDVVLRLAGWSRIVEGIAQRAQQDGLRNIVFLRNIPRRDVVEETAAADITLGGPFLAIPKTENVIAGKVFEMIAMGKPVIIGDSPAARELFVDGENAVLCRMSSPEALADAIAKLAADPALRERIGASGYDLYDRRLRPGINVRPLLPVLADLARKGQAETRR